MAPLVHCHYLGKIDYKEAWDLQEKLFQEGVQRKIDIRNGNGGELPQNHLLFCEHPHVFTLGKSGDKDHMLLTEEQLKQNNAKFYQINRGGDITYHGPGQLVIYPIFDLEQFFTDIHKYMRYLEESVIQTLSKFGVHGERLDGLTGVWLDSNTVHARKICAMGVKSSRWITMHGIGFNVSTDLSYFNHIIPCGIQNKAVTSLEKETNSSITVAQVIPIILQELKTLFEFEIATL
jgi:lipoyl(octanoyl) transferase